MCFQYIPHGGICDVVISVLECSLNPIESPRGILPGEADNGIHDHLSDSWPTRLTLATGIKLLRNEFTVPAEDRVWRDDGCQLAQSFAADSVSLHGKQATLVVVEKQSLFSELLQQGLDLSVLEFDDLLLALVHNARECGEQ